LRAARGERSHSVSDYLIQLRLFQPADLETLYRIDQVCFPPGIAYSKAELRYYIQHPKSFTLIAETDAQAILGFCTGQEYLRGGKPAGHIITIDMLPEARRQKIGHRLLGAVEEHFRNKGIVSMQLEVAVDNLPAQLFYRSMGYERLGRIPGYYNGKLDALAMEKNLLPVRDEL
jgi:ribosomal-protein-alanine N-acetyltransferase